MTPPTYTRDRRRPRRTGQGAPRPTSEPPERRSGWIWLTLVALSVLGLTVALVTSLPTADDAGSVVTSAAADSSQEAAAAAEGTGSDDAVDAPVTPEASASAEPADGASSASFATAGNGRIAPVSTAGEDTGRTGREIRWSVEAEQGLGIDLEEFAQVVGTTLRDSQGWEREGGVHFVRVPRWQVEDGARVDVRVTLASPETTDRLCAPMDTAGKVSCWNQGRAVINSRRWVYGAATYDGRRADYRTYLINHEVGHGLGYGHEPCYGAGRRASIMLQQTISLDRCRAWPTPGGDGGRR